MTEETEKAGTEKTFTGDINAEIEKIVDSYMAVSYTHLMYASGGPSGASTTQGIFIYNSFNQDLNYGRGSAASVVLMFVIAILTMVQMHFEKSEKG